MNEDAAELVTLSLATLAEGLPALTPAIGGYLAESASVCLENQHYPFICRLSVQHLEETVYLLERLSVDEQMRLGHNDLQDATEFGACGVAILAIGEITGWTIVEKSIKGTGFDYWLGEADENFVFHKKARLEVSGILRGDQSMVDIRLRQKIAQTYISDGEYPAYIVVVEFSRPQAKVVQR